MAQEPGSPLEVAHVPPVATGQERDVHAGLVPFKP
jgi:hypothetical protein